MITLAGISRFRLQKEVEGFTPYRALRRVLGRASSGISAAKPTSDTRLRPHRVPGLLDRYFEARDLSADWDSLKEADDELLINSLSMLLDFEPEDKQALLEAPSLSTRRETLVTLIEYCAARRSRATGLMQ